MFIFKGKVYRQAARVKPDTEAQRYAAELYEKAHYTANGRVVCERKDPRFEQVGMKAYDMSDIDPGLAGYYGVHIGDPDLWLPTLYLEGDCNNSAYVYTIDVGDHDDFYIMDDPHPMQGGGESWILFSPLPTIPPEMVKLEQVITEDELYRAYHIDDNVLSEIEWALGENSGVLREKGIDVEAVTEEQLITIYNDLCEEQPDCGESYEAPVMGGRPSGPLVEGYEEDVLRTALENL